MKHEAPPPIGVRYQERGQNYEVREAAGAQVMTGHFAVFDTWTEIDSLFEGTFMERIAPGAFAETFKDHVPKVTFNHGRDVLGDQVLGVPDRLEEDDVGAAYDVPLLAGVPDLLVNGLRAGAYGSSFRFRVEAEEFNRNTKASDHNPKGLPERTILEASVPEFGPVTFPAYPEATAGVRTLSALDLMLEREGLPRFSEFVEHLKRGDEDGPRGDVSPIPRQSPALPRHDEWMRQRRKDEAHAS